MSLRDVSLAGRRRWHTLAFSLVAFWIVVGVGITVAGFVGAPVVWWDLIHPFTLGALTTAILVFSTHFTEALTRTPSAGYRGVGARVALVQLGLVLLLIDRASYDWGVLADIGSTLVIVAVAWHLWALWSTLRGSLSGSFAVTVPFYLAAACFMVASVAFVVVAAHGVGNYSLLVAAHSRGMVWGFAFLTILGTVVTLLPTFTRTPISAMARARCSRALTVHCVGLAIAMLADASGLTRAAGMAQLLAVLAAVLIIQPVLAGALGGVKNTASVSAMAGLVWMVALCAGDAAATIAGAYPRAVTLLLMPAFVGAGLLQLVTGVLHHMLPILAGAARPARGQTAGLVRVGAINLGGVLSVLGIAGVSTAGLIMMGLGLIANIAALVWAVTSSQGEGHVKRAR
ncbi:beta-carotene 15,15'-monooxygenase [Corynebacterium sp. YSMAA1_1_D6]|uniref:beta-carotene 15,15'-monooxygenase n=1 Tax=Corynebacterium sp. YSMAA1_1_D6 TaxID=3383589 RepID=UPI0038D19DF3